MAYNKHVWSGGEGITSALLNNIENAVDGMSDTAYTFTGQKTFTGNDPVVEKASAGIRLKDTGGKEFWIRSTGDKLEVYEQGVGVSIADLIAHVSRHQPGGDDALPVGTPSDIGGSNAEGASTSLARLDHQHNHPSGIGADLHHNESHGPSVHTDRTQTIFTPGMAMWGESTVYDEDSNVAGPKLQNGSTQKVLGTCKVPTGEVWKNTDNRPVYLHVKSFVAVAGDIYCDVLVRKWGDGDLVGTTVFSLIGQAFSFTSAQYKRFNCGSTLDLSSPGDMLTFRITRYGGHGSDTYAGDVVIAGFEIIPESDQ